MKFKREHALISARIHFFTGNSKFWTLTKEKFAFEDLTVMSIEANILYALRFFYFVGVGDFEGRG